MNHFLHQDCERTRQVYQACLDLIPHKKVTYTFPFSGFNLKASYFSLNISHCADRLWSLLCSRHLFQFTFAKLWLLYAQFEIRQKNLQGARKIMVRLDCLTILFPAFKNTETNRFPLVSQGTAIGKCPKNKLLKGYIELELQLREFDRCRKLYEKYLEFSPENCTTWIKFAELETILGDVDRARAIFELAIGQPRLDMPEVATRPTSVFCLSRRTKL